MISVIYLGFIESRVRAIVNDPKFIEQVARSVRPALVFDARGSILADMGAMELLESIPEIIVAAPGEKNYKSKIIIRPKKFISEPILEPLDETEMSVETRHSSGLAWEITLSPRFITTGLPEKQGHLNDAPLRYRLELTVR